MLEGLKGLKRLKSAAAVAATAGAAFTTQACLDYGHHGHDSLTTTVDAGNSGSPIEQCEPQTYATIKNLCDQGKATAMMCVTAAGIDENGAVNTQFVLYPCPELGNVPAAEVNSSNACVAVKADETNNLNGVNSSGEVCGTY